MSTSKKRAAPRPPTNGVSSPIKPNESANSSNGTASVGDGFIDKTIELTVVLPDQSQEKIHIVPSTALFDLRTQLCGKYKLNPSSHKLEPVDKNGRAISCTSSSTIESSEAVAVHLIPRVKDMPKITPIKTVEQTVRLTVKTSQAHQQVVRVKPNVPLRTILNNILDKTNSSKENQKYLELRHPLRIKEALDLSKSLDEYDKLREVFVVDTRVHNDSDAETVSFHTADKQYAGTREGSTKKKKKIKSLFKFGKKKSKGQIVSPTSTSPPASIREAPEFFNEKGVDTGALESKRPTSLKQSTSQQNETLHGQVFAKMQERNAQGSNEVLNEEETDVKKTPTSPPARPIAPPRTKSQVPGAATRPHTTGKKKAPAPPTPSLPTSPAEPSSPTSPTARPEKPPRRQSIEKQKEVSESQQHNDEVDGEREQGVGASADAAIAATTATASVDDVSISSAEEAGIEIVNDGLSNGRLTPDDIDNETKQVSDVIQISEEESVDNVGAPIEDAASITNVTSDEDTNTELSATKDDAVSYEEELPKETDRVVKVEEPVTITSPANTDVTSQQSQKLEVPHISDNAEHHIITPSLGFAMKDMVTEDDLRDLSDCEMPVIVDEESDTDGDEPSRDEDEIAGVDVSNVPPPTIRDAEEEKHVPLPVKQEQELPSPTPIEDNRPPSPPTVNQNKEAPTSTVSTKELSATLQEPKLSPEVKQMTIPPQQPDVEKVISNVTEEPLQPPPLKDDENLFTMPSDYNAYEEPDIDMASIETQALAMLQQFTTSAADDQPPPPVIDVIAPARIEIKTESKVPSPPSGAKEVPSPTSVTKEVVPASIPAKKIELKSPTPKQDVDEPSDEQTMDEIAKLKAQLEAAKQKLAQKEAEAEHARKNPYTIIPEQNPPEAGQIGKRKTLTFVPTQRPARSFEDYETAPQTVISITKGGDIRGMVLVKEKKQGQEVEEKPSAPNEKTVPIVSTSSSTPLSNAVEQPRSKTAVPVVKRAPATATGMNNYPRSNDTTSGDTKGPSVASIMVNHLQSKSAPKEEIPDVKIVPSQGYTTTQPSQAAPQPKTDAITRKPSRVAGGYVGSAILKQPATVDSKPSVPSVYDWTSSKKSTLPNYYKRFLGIDAVTGTNKAADKFKANVEEKRNVPNWDSGASTQRNVTQQPATDSPSSPTKPAVAMKPVSLEIKSNSSSASQSSMPPIAASLNKALNPSPITSLPLPPEEKSSGGVKYQFDATPLPPPPEEFLSPASTTKSSPKAVQTTTSPSPTSPKTGSLSLGYVGISSAKPFGSSAGGGPKFRPMSATFKDESNSNPMIDSRRWQ